MTDSDKLKRVGALLMSLHDEFAASVREMDNDGTGIQLPFNGDFPPHCLPPSMRNRIRWWERRMRQVLKEIGAANG